MKWSNLLFDVSLLSVMVVIRIFFINKYPCTVSCIGCHSMIDMLQDTWVELMATSGIIISLILIIKDIPFVDGQ